MKHTPDKSLLPNIIGAADEVEIARFRQRTIEGLITSAKSGNYPKGGKLPPTGYCFVYNTDRRGRRIEIDPTYVDTMIYMFHQLHDHKRSIESLAYELDSKKACETSWSPSKVYKAVVNPIIYGHLKTIYVDIEYHSPALMTKHYYDEMQTIIRGRRKEHHYRYLFKNLVKCGECDTWYSEIPTIHYPRNALTTTQRKRNKKVYKYYYCPNCNKRINETLLLTKMVFHIHSVMNDQDNIQLSQIVHWN